MTPSFATTAASTWGGRIAGTKLDNAEKLHCGLVPPTASPCCGLRSVPTENLAGAIFVVYLRKFLFRGKTDIPKHTFEYKAPFLYREQHTPPTHNTTPTPPQCPTAGRKRVATRGKFAWVAAPAGSEGTRVRRGQTRSIVGRKQRSHRMWRLGWTSCRPCEADENRES